MNMQMSQVSFNQDQSSGMNDSMGRFSNNSEALTSMAISFNNQAVIELKQKNPEQAVKLSE